MQEVRTPASDRTLIIPCKGEPSKPGTQLWHVTSDTEAEELRALPFPACTVSN